MTPKRLWTAFFALMTAGGILAVSHIRAEEEQDAPKPARSPYAKAEIVLPIGVAGQEADGPPASPGGGAAERRDGDAGREKLNAPVKNLTQPPALPLNFEPAPAAERGWVRADYLLWWIKKGPTPVLLTTGDPLFGQGVLGEPDTRIVIGSDTLDYGTLSGIRVGAGYNFSDDQMWGVQFSGFFMQDKDLTRTASSDGSIGSPLLARPFLSVVDTQEGSLVSASPGELSGTFNVQSSSSFWGFDVNTVAHCIRTADRRFDFLAGFRAMALDEGLVLSENITTLADGAIIFQQPPVGQVTSQLQPLQGSVISTLDDFQTRNRFYGGQLGGRFQWIYQRWTLDMTSKIAFGFTHQTATIAGASSLNGTVNDANNVPVAINIATPGGVFAQPTNSGTYVRDQFAIVPEVILQVHYDLTPRVRASVGYNGVYWSAVARPGDQIDRNLNTKLVPTGQGFAENFDPAQEQTGARFIFRDNGFWAHGLNFGVEFRY